MMNSSSAPASATSPLPPIDSLDLSNVCAPLRPARVTGRIGDWLLLDDPVGRARRADGCLLAPDVGDIVLIWASEGVRPDNASGVQPAYVLTVLARGGAPQAALALPGGVVFETGIDGLRIDAPRIALAACNRIDASAPYIDLIAHCARVRTAHLDACSQSIDGRAHDVRFSARRFTSTIGRALHTFGNCFRRVCGVDDMRAGRVRWRIDERAHLHAGDVTLLADGHVGIDGDRIDLG
ncbi:DUF3540 domain-containing protein [Burkholderia ubonensis]|uniref:DUF3540 domain-containing protein n=1 Tax=Burkholderia ubonensis TaxID=101571 RepID=UPI000B0668C3